MNKVLIIILLIILTPSTLAQEARRERFLVTRPGDSAAFARHPGRQAPGRGFALRYRFEGNDGAIRRICERIEAEINGSEVIREGDENTFPDSGESLRLNEELMAEALASLGTATETMSATASEPAQAASRQ
ncbi:hypothetical protein KBA41_07385 [Candidatus Ozemobacteraceae bacterium]|nr:hypothetical protein [Candidatus Ozemobacteraceae bacterium]